MRKFFNLIDTNYVMIQVKNMKESKKSFSGSYIINDLKRLCMLGELNYDSIIALINKFSEEGFLEMLTRKSFLDICKSLKTSHRRDR